MGQGKKCQIQLIICIFVRICFIKNWFMKKPNLVYYVENFVRYTYPKSLCRLQTNRIFAKAEKRKDFNYILDRVNYYNKLDDNFTPPHQYNFDNEIISVRGFKFFSMRNRGPSAYFFDTYEFVRFFPVANKFSFVFGDVTHIPSVPSIVKSRPVAGDNRNSIVLKLDKLRHFFFIKDRISFREKDNKIIFYADMRDKPHRIGFMKKYFGHPECICGDITGHESIPKEWFVKKISIKEHLTHKFVLALEGNDVATNLKWIMSSNCLAVMPKPKYETWFMEGLLIPDFHYVEIKDDYSDLIERMNYYIKNPAEAEKIIKNANEYISQFKNKRREKIISLMVLRKYFNRN